MMSWIPNSLTSCGKSNNILCKDLVKVIRFRQLHHSHYTLLHDKHFIALVIIIEAIILLCTVWNRSMKYPNGKSDKDMFSLIHSRTQTEYDILKSQVHSSVAFEYKSIWITWWRYKMEAVSSQLAFF